MTYNVFGGTLNLTPLNSTVSKVWFWHDLVRNAVCPPHSWTIFTFLYHKVAKWGCWRRDAAQYPCSWRLLGCWALHSAVHLSGQWCMLYGMFVNCEHVILQKYKPLVWEFHQIYNLDAVLDKDELQKVRGQGNDENSYDRKSSVQKVHLFDEGGRWFAVRDHLVVVGCLWNDSIKCWRWFQFQLI